MNGAIYLGLFRQGMDTAQIAEKFGADEAVVYKEIHQARQRQHFLKRGREAWHRYWSSLSREEKSLTYWRKRMRRAGFTNGKIYAIQESRAGSSPIPRVSGPSA